MACKEISQKCAKHYRYDQVWSLSGPITSREHLLTRSSAVVAAISGKTVNLKRERGLGVGWKLYDPHKFSSRNRIHSVRSMTVCTHRNKSLSSTLNISVYNCNFSPTAPRLNKLRFPHQQLRHSNRSLWQRCPDKHTGRKHARATKRELFGLAKMAWVTQESAFLRSSKVDDEPLEWKCVWLGWCLLMLYVIIYKI